jgi:hypothetical protein
MVHLDIGDRDSKQRQGLRNDKPAEDGDSQRLTQQLAGTRPECDRQDAEYARYRRHHDRPEAKHGSLERR